MGSEMLFGSNVPGQSVWSSARVAEKLTVKANWLTSTSSPLFTLRRKFRAS
jgi:hypothetical protein